jgi:hypothetical protein
MIVETSKWSLNTSAALKTALSPSKTSWLGSLNAWRAARLYRRAERLTEKTRKLNKLIWRLLVRAERLRSS